MGAKVRAAQKLPVNPSLPYLSTVHDRLGNSMSTLAAHRLTDIGLGVVEPVWASDGIHSDSVSPASGALREFDGTGRLMDRDITVQMRIEADQLAGSGAALLYDVDPPVGSLRPPDGLWLPSTVGGLVPEANRDARSAAAFLAQGDLRQFLIPGLDPEIVTGGTVELVARVGDLYCARLADPEDILSLAPWLIPIQDITRQRSGVTILNNVIDPTQGEKTVLSYTLKTTGPVTITVFNLAADPVRVLLRDRQGAGEYDVSWDGRNTANTVVARGVYFIRIVAPGIDETRKILVEK